MMNGKIGFWRWLLLKIWKGIKTIPKLPKLMRDIDPAFEMTLSILGFLLGMLLFSRINYWMGFLAGDDKDFERILYRTHGARYRWRMSLPDFVAYHHNYKCPNCGARLHTKPVSIAIKPWNGNKEEERNG